MREFIVRTCLMLDLLCAVPSFIALIWWNPEAYSGVLERSGASVRKHIEKYRKGEL